MPEVAWGNETVSDFGGGVYQRDYPVVQGTVMLFAVTLLLINLGVDLLYTYLDPR